MLDRLRKLMPRKWRSDAPIIPVVRMTGAIAAGGSALRPSLSIAGVADQLERAFAVKAAPAVAIIINSPGGSAVQSRLIHKRIRDLAAEKDKKVLVFVEDAAASGGYMIACAGDEIIADPASIIGSIGVVAALFGFPDALSRIGVERRVHTAGKNKFANDPFLPEKKEDVAHLKSVLEDMHTVFIDIVKASRGSRLADHPDLFSGQYWLAGKAVELGLIDGIGDIRSTIRQRYGDKAELKLVSAPRGLFGRKAGMPGISGALAAASGNAMASAGAGLADAIAAEAEAQALWARIGLAAPR
jgi:signal peptide peptidase SppA